MYEKIKATNPCGTPAVPTQNDITTLPPPILNSPYRNEEPQILVATATSWLRSRPIRYCILLLCSPLLVPFFCATFPLLCAAHLCLRVCRRRNRGSREDAPLLRCEEGRQEEEKEEVEGGGVGLLQRYLEDQMLLVGSVYDCGDQDDHDPTIDPRTPLLAC